jgi:hypothetical protein
MKDGRKIGWLERGASQLRVSWPHLMWGFGLAILFIAVTVMILPDATSGDRRWLPTFAGVGFCLWVITWFVERNAQKRIPAFTTVMAAVALSAALLHSGHDIVKTFQGEFVRSWNVYHYYVGSKYFAELGYFDLYPATLVADDNWQKRNSERAEASSEELELDRGFSHITRTRNMHDYKVVSRKSSTAGFDRSLISEARLDELGEDTRDLRPFLEDDKWERIMVDLGYNATPSWAVVGAFLSNLIHLKTLAFRCLINMDLLFYFTVFVGLWWAFDLRVALIATLWLSTIHFNRGRFAGGFFQYDWLASSVLAVALYAKKRPRSAGIVLSWGVMTRVFPVFMLLPIGIGMVHDLGERRFTRHRMEFLTSCLISCVLLAGMAGLSGRGLGVWFEWVDAMSVHSHYHSVTSNKRIGVARLALHQPRIGKFWAEYGGNRENRLAESGSRKWILILVGFAVLIPTLVKRSDTDGMILALFAVFLAVTLSRYYASIWVLLFALGTTSRDKRIPFPAFIAGAVLLGMATWFGATLGTTGNYFLANYEAYVLFVGLCVYYLVGDFRNMGKGENKIEK